MIKQLRNLRSFNHPIIRVALNHGQSAMAYRRFMRSVRISLDQTLSAEQRLVHAREILRSLPDLPWVEGAMQEFLWEWLRCVSVELNDMVLLDACALAGLHEFRLTLAPSQWERLTVTPDELPQLKRLDGRSFESPLSESPLDFWQEVIALTRLAVASGEDEHWETEQCLAAIRALAICCVAGRIDSGASDPVLALRFLEGEGTYLWSSIAKRVQDLRGHSIEQRWLANVRARMLLHLQGLVQTNIEKLAKSQAKDGPHPQAAQALAGPGELIVITQPIPPANDRSDNELIKQFEPLRQPVSVGRMPTPAQIDEMLRTLANEFPWAPDVIERLEEMLILPSRLGVQQLILRPVLLVGPPGSGKSRLCRRLADLLGWPYMPIACGGSGDIKQLSGTARGWASGEPMPLLRTMLTHRTASVFCLLDEVDKAADTASRSPPLMSLLLGLLEPETAARYRDGYLQVPCDLSRVAFWSTANSLSAVPEALQSRLDCPRRFNIDHLCRLNFDQGLALSF
jgi:hypothetical protein